MKTTTSTTKPATIAAAYAIVALLAGTAIVYFLAAAEELPQANAEQAAMLESILFLGSGIGYSAIAGWIMLNLHHGRYNRIPYTLAICGSVFLIALYIVSRMVALPTVGLQTDVGTLDMVAKVLQGIVILFSVCVVLRVYKLDRIKREMHV